MTVKFPIKICEKPVAKNHHAIQCDSYNLWIHIKCNKINPQTYKHLQNSNAEWYCINMLCKYHSLLKAFKSAAI